MEPAIDRLFLEFSAKKLDQLCARIREAASRLNQDQVWARGSENQNAVGNLILHLSGNVRQWILSGIGGQPDVRVRDREFAARREIPVADLLERLANTVCEAVDVLKQVSAERLMERVTIQKYDVTVLEAIYHVVEHFSQHTGQIIFAAKLLTEEDLGFYRHLSSAGTARGEPTP